jgi:hypothetical protein
VGHLRSESESECESECETEPVLEPEKKKGQKPCTADNMVSRCRYQEKREEIKVRQSGI